MLFLGLLLWSDEDDPLGMWIRGFPKSSLGKSFLARETVSPAEVCVGKCARSAERDLLGHRGARSPIYEDLVGCHDAANLNRLMRHPLPLVSLITLYFTRVVCFITITFFTIVTL